MQRLRVASLIAGLAVALACLTVLLIGFPSKPDPSTPPPPDRGAPTRTAQATPPGRSTPRRVAAAETPDGAIVLIITDSRSAARLDAVRVCMGEASRSLRVEGLAVLARSDAGVASLPLPGLEDRATQIDLVLLHDGYVPTRSAVPAEPGTYRLQMAKGRPVTVAVADAHGRPLEQARVSFFAKGSMARSVELALLQPHDDPEAGLEYSFGSHGWHVVVPTGPDGVARATIPQSAATVFADKLGWFPSVLRPPSGCVDIPADSRGAPVDVDLVLSPVWCAVLSARSLRVLGALPVASDLRAWRRVHNIHARHARALVVDTLRRRYPGDMVHAECLLAPAGHDPLSPDVSRPRVALRAMVDGLGLTESDVPLQPFSAVALHEMDLDARPERMGTLMVAPLDGYRHEWPAALSASLLDEGERPQLPGMGPPELVAFDLHYGSEYAVEPGIYRVFQKGRMGVPSVDIGRFEVRTGERTRVAVSARDARWPVELAIRDASGAAPRFCKLQLWEPGQVAASGEHWQSRPRDPRRIVTFLEAGSYAALATCGDVESAVHRFQVEPGHNRCTIELPW